MDARFEEWIREHYPTSELARNQCSIATREMLKQFPELLRVRGWYGWTQHWWLKTANGEVVDPTAMQFSQPIDLSFYREFREGIDAEMIGKCPDCGEELWDKDPETLEPIVYSCMKGFCSKECEHRYMAYINSGS